MIIRALDTNKDWTYGKGKNDYLRNVEAISLNVETRLREWKGDCFFAITNGVDYNNFLDVGTKDFLDRDVKRVIIQSEGVIKIKSYESDINRDDREFTAQATFLTIFGSAKVTI
jgi:hypothetical protein